MEIILLFKALVSRLLFIGHGVYAVYLYYMSTHDYNDLFLVTPVALIVFEAGITLLYRKGVEFKYVWPSGFLYISCLVPIIWMIEFSLLEVRIRDHKDSYANKQTNETEPPPEISRHANQQIRGELLLKAILGSNELRKKVCELGLIIGIIIGRWMVPRGELTRDQLSALLLGYVSNSADILELFTTFEEPELFDSRPVTIAIMVVFTLSVYQFALNSTATMVSEEDKQENKPRTYNNKVHPHGAVKKRDSTLTNDYITEVRTRRVTLHTMPGRESRGRGRKTSVPAKKVSVPGRKISRTTTMSDIKIKRKNTLPPINRTPEPINGSAEKDENAVKRRAIHGEVFQILVTLLMQDGPFLILRAYLIIVYSVASEMHIFFTCKNAIVSILLVYRLLILSCSGKDEETEWHREEAESKLRNIQKAIEDMKLKDVEASTMYVG